MAKLNDIIKAGIVEYTGREVIDVKTYEDSVGAIAIRATFMPERRAPKGTQVSLDFLIASFDVERCKDATTTANLLEEVEFTSWPPKESGPKFF